MNEETTTPKATITSSMRIRVASGDYTSVDLSPDKPDFIVIGSITIENDEVDAYITVLHKALKALSV